MVTTDGAEQPFWDKELTCVDCGDRFMWTTGEQGFYADRNLAMPKRCRPCRMMAREARERGLEQR